MCINIILLLQQCPRRLLKMAASDGHTAPMLLCGLRACLGRPAIQFADTSSQPTGHSGNSEADLYGEPISI